MKEDEILVVLDTVYKQGASKHEYRHQLRASCTYEGVYYEEAGKDDNLWPLIRLIPWQESAIHAQVRVVRGGTTVFDLVPLKSWLHKPDARPEYLRKKTV